MKYKCEKCNMEFNNNGARIRHQNPCLLGEKTINDYLFGVSLNDIKNIYKADFNTIKRYLILNGVEIRTNEEAILISKKPKLKHTEESKRLISEKRKLYLKENPDKHPWKRNTKFKSVPCENFKKILNELNISYVPEYTISDEKSYSIDIALPQYKIAIEINGNQHYNNDGKLTNYYQKRHNFILNLGYKIHELHYSLFFDKEKMVNLINTIIENKPLFDFNYDQYLIDKLNNESTHKKCECGKDILIISKKCNECSSFSKRKVERPPIDFLIEEYNNIGYSAMGRKYGVCDKTIKKWIKKAV